MIRQALLAIALRATACLGVDGSHAAVAVPPDRPCCCPGWDCVETMASVCCPGDLRSALDAGTASADQATADVAAARDLVPWGNCVWDAGAIRCEWAAGDGGGE